MPKIHTCFKAHTVNVIFGAGQTSSRLCGAVLVSALQEGYGPTRISAQENEKKDSGDEGCSL